jgi:hypothetical protein
MKEDKVAELCVYPGCGNEGQVYKGMTLCAEHRKFAEFILVMLSHVKFVSRDMARQQGLVASGSGIVTPSGYGIKRQE